MKNIFAILILSILVSCASDSNEGIETGQEKENQSPSIPVIVYPLNNTLCINNNVMFEWEPSTDPEQNSVKYKLEVAENNSFSPLIISRFLFKSSKLIQLPKGKRLFWRIKAVDNRGAESLYSEVAQFLIENESVVNHAPLAPSLEFPKKGSEIVGLSTTLAWQSSDPDDDLVTYDVYLDDKNPPITRVSENQTLKNFEVLDLMAQTTYYFRVDVKDIYGNNTIGEVWRFKTK
ncbi:MAG: hypothetical protein ACN4EF_02990 [Wenyingzhuangia sp.]|jgi:hypothetical protein|uniref:hypothetical protein n=1 Tax=Wenyingzhuangia sp. TaxID=1964193 RepID=UPI00321B2F76